MKQNIELKGDLKLNLKLIYVTIYRIYPKYWDILTLYQTSPKKFKVILLPHDVYNLVLDEWQTV